MLLLSLVSNYLATSRWLSLASLASLLRLGVGTAVWWGWARTAFPALEAATGRSLELSTGLREILQSPDKALSRLQLYATRTTCRRSVHAEQPREPGRVSPGGPHLDRLRRLGPLLPAVLEQPLHAGGVPAGEQTHLLPRPRQ